MTLFVTTGVGEGVWKACRATIDHYESDGNEPRNASSADVAPGDDNGVEGGHDSGGHVVSFLNVDKASLEASEIPGRILYDEGCNEGCSAVNDDGYYAMARSQGLFLYSGESEHTCSSVDHPKTFLHCYGNYVLLVTAEQANAAPIYIRCAK